MKTHSAKSGNFLMKKKKQDGEETARPSPFREEGKARPDPQGRNGRPGPAQQGRGESQAQSKLLSRLRLLQLGYLEGQAPPSASKDSFRTPTRRKGKNVNRISPDTAIHEQNGYETT